MLLPLVIYEIARSRTGKVVDNRGRLVIHVAVIRKAVKAIGVG